MAWGVCFSCGYLRPVVVGCGFVSYGGVVDSGVVAVTRFFPSCELGTIRFQRYFISYGKIITSID